VLLAGNPPLGALALGTYGLTTGMLLVLETVAIGRGAGPGGLLGMGRTQVFYRMSGSFLMASALVLITQAVR
jgi:hypothetical protein